MLAPPASPRRATACQGIEESGVCNLLLLRGFRWTGKMKRDGDAALPSSKLGADYFMSENNKTPANYTPFQQKVIKRYYNNHETIQRQRLAELVGELYLAQGKKRQRAWEAAAAAMQKLGVPPSRIDHLLKQANPALVAELVKELEGKR
jgi:hypothetical protein